MKICLTKSLRHSPVSSFNSELTLASPGKVFGGVVGQKEDGRGSYLSCQIWAKSPLPICHLQASLTTHCAAIRLHHAKDGLEPNLACRKSVCGNYRAFRTWDTREWVLVCSRHPCLARSAKLKDLRLRKPKPPISLGVQTLSQDSQAILFFPLDCPHQKARIMLVISSQSVSGSLKTLIV